ncbi:RagB/SusD family nutrient uptake outer membrane protein [Mesonia sp. K4-1]|uniref:RagB/SusD family nutrient uptake outer membrane protein n=1 Tax=Mesonia sp. K4-1 TaxID=2602760 RepID=UPI0011CC0959|nr:RagB/SusD family nutrient uptake outer membrane protein [Mesonia sp. K4-1]TXK75049.1 RagB/SusD family nutrient uptake outer membrane protein [Mesonia sp. K4-1]
MKNNTYLILMSTLLIGMLLTSCQEWLDIEEPDYKLVSSKVFDTEETAEAAMQGIYNQLYQASFSAGWLGSTTVLAGLSADNLELINTNTFDLLGFQNHQLHPENSYNEGLWGSAYNMIYMVNSLLEGLEVSTKVSPETAQRLEGEARFVRAFTYFYLVNLYGEVPLVLGTDYQENAVEPRSSKQAIYENILADLGIAANALGNSYSSGERTQINAYTAKALLARVHLYLENWELAEIYSSEVIAASGTYSLPTDLNEVFLANSPEAIWQLSPIGNGTGLTHTNEGSVFIINPYIPSFSYVKLTADLVNYLDEEDQRKIDWIGYHEGLDVYHAYKYKIHNATGEATEYSMILRLAEQYLIRAEARAQQNDLSGAIADLDHIKQRAGLELLSENNPGISQSALLEEVVKERRKELFTEWGHRWLDVKRWDTTDQVFAPYSPDWESTDVLYPLPATELLSNPQLIQNAGY